jgi:hypothetical protein
MSTLSGGPGPIVTNGLVLYLDAANPNAAPTRNLFTYTTDLTNAAWTKTRCSITASAAIAPDGTNTAFAFNMSTGSADLKRLTASTITSAVSGGLYTFSIFVKQNNFSGSGNISAGLQLGSYNSGQTAGLEPIFNVLSNFQPTGSFVLGPASSGSAVDRGTIDVGNGWYRIYATCNWASSIAAFSTFLDLDNGTVTGSQYEGTGIYIWGPQFETGYLSSYQPVTGTTKPWPIIGSSTTASMINNPTWISNNGGSVVFDGVNDYVDISTTPNLTNPLTICAFVNTSVTTGSNQVIYGPSANGQDNWLSISNNRAQIFATQTSDVNNFSITGTTTIQANTWYHITGIVNNNVISLYINGVFEAASSAQAFTIGGWNSAARIGQRATGQFPFNGRIANICGYNRALSQAEITQNYNALKSRFNLT